MATDVQYRYKPGTRYPSTVQHTTLYQFIGTLECTSVHSVSVLSRKVHSKGVIILVMPHRLLWSSGVPGAGGAGYESLAVEVSKKNISAGCPPYILYGE